MILGTTGPAVVGGFVVVPDGDQRRRGAQGLEIGIRVVLGIALAVIVEADDLTIGLELAAAGGVLRLLKASGAVFVDVVTQMQPGVVGVGCIDGGGPAIGGKSFCGWEIGTGKDRQPHGIAAYRQGLGLPHHRHRLTGDEAVVIGGVGVEAIGLRLHRPVAGCVGAERTAIHDCTGLKAGATRNLPTDINPPSSALRWCNPSPENHRVGIGIATGDTVGKTDERCGHGLTRMLLRKDNQSVSD